MDDAEARKHEAGPRTSPPPLTRSIRTKSKQAASPPLPSIADTTAPSSLHLCKAPPGPSWFCSSSWSSTSTCRLPNWGIAVGVLVSEISFLNFVVLLQMAGGQGYLNRHDLPRQCRIFCPLTLSSTTLLLISFSSRCSLPISWISPHSLPVPIPFSSSVFALAYNFLLPSPLLQLFVLPVLTHEEPKIKSRKLLLKIIISKTSICVRKTRWSKDFLNLINVVLLKYTNTFSYSLYNSSFPCTLFS